MRKFLPYILQNVLPTFAWLAVGNSWTLRDILQPSFLGYSCFFFFCMDFLLFTAVFVFAVSFALPPRNICP